ncbi:MAG: prolyl oligopeptidase family serine peptidase [Pirellulales bacterium]|nr:prolyl oligopeptidase family serine peptidase [Pirellulales bacterium]
MQRIQNIFCLLLVVCIAGLAPGQEAKLKYPETRRVDQVDTFYGVDVADPYRWLEEDPRNSPEVASWIKAQNDVARKYLDAIPSRKEFAERLKELWNYPRYSVPQQTAGKYFFHKNDGLQDQSVLYVSDTCAAEGRILLDPNSWSEDGTISLGAAKVSDDGRYLAYGRKESGSDWSTIYVQQVDTGEALDDQLLWTRWGNIVWNAQSTGFFYTRYPEPKEGQQFQSSVTDPMIYFHRLETLQAEDVLVYCRPDHPTWSFWLEQTDDNRFLVLSIGRSTDPQNQVWYRPVAAPLDSAWVPLVEDFENEFEFVGNVGEQFYFRTDFKAPTKRVVAMDRGAPGREQLAEVIPASDATLESVALLAGDRLVASYLRDVVSQVRVIALDGSLISEVEMPGAGSAHGFGGRKDDTETFYMFTSYNMPTSIYRYDLTAGRSEQIRAPQIDFPAAKFEVRQAFYESADGTRIPILVTHRRGLELDGQNPTLLYGYGGFNISLTPRFSVEYAVWMEQGGVVAVANLRGGGEYGEPWHQAGKKTNKQNVFDDFIAAAEWLVAERYTSSQRLAIKGGSNGGLLVGAVMTQRPELFGACLPAVGVMDMLRYQIFTAGHFWRDEFGTVDDPEEFKAVYAYSPYHNLQEGKHYPATMVTTADTDDRVVPMHSFKFGAALQRAQAGSGPTLLRIEKRAGHGAGTPISKRIDAAADNWAFLWRNLGMESGE